MQDASVATAIAISAVVVAVTCVAVAVKLTRILEALFLGATVVLEGGLPYSDIELLSLGEIDRADSIKEFFEWKHKALMKILELALGFLFTNALILLKLALGGDDKESKVFRDILGLDLRATTIAIALGVIFTIGVCGQRLRRIPDEYMLAVTFLSWLRGY